MAKRLGLVLGLALIIFACEDPGEIGLELNPENGLFVAKYQEIPLENSVILYENMVSDNAVRIDSFNNVTSGGRLLVGSFQNEQFGSLEAKAFAGLYLGSVGFSNDGAGFIFDSLVFRIKIDYLYGNSLLGNKRISIHELTDSLKLDTLYQISNATTYNEVPLGEFNFDFSINDTVWVDTVLITRLSDELGMRFIEEATVNDVTFSNNNDFRKFFNGFAFVPDEMNNVVTGILPENSFSFLRMHFHNAEDTSFLDFIFQDLDTVPRNITKNYNSITLDRAGTPLANIPGFNTDFQTPNDLTYIQAGAGIFTKVNFEPFLDFIDTVDHLVINRAEVQIPVEAYNKNTYPSSPLDIYVIDENNDFVELFRPGRPNPEYLTIGKLTFSKDRNENSGTYVVDLTEYVQDLTSGESVETKFALGQTSVWNGILAINQSILRKNEISLRVYYSTVQ